MANATLETRGAKDIENATRNSFASFERTSASRRKLSSVLRLAWDVMVYDKCVSHFKTVSHALKTPYQDVMSRHSDTLPRHPIKTSCQDTQSRFQDTLYQDTHELELAIISTELALYFHPVGVICCHVSCLPQHSQEHAGRSFGASMMFLNHCLLPRASKEHGCLKLWQFLLFARQEWCQE